MIKSLKYLLRAVWLRVSHTYGLLMVNSRKIPNFLIIGAQKSGTSSLFFYLKFHPEIKRPIKKEIHYFNIHFDKGLDWYKAHFPKQSENYLTGEASPDYIFHPDTPKRVKGLNPEMKLILLVRDPIVRAYSAYQMNKRMGIDKRATFEEAVDFELSEKNKNKSEYDYDRHNYFYLERGLYARQLEQWTSVFDRNQILVISSKIFFSQTETVLKQVYRFLEISENLPPTLKPMNVGKYPPLLDRTYKSLKQYYAEDSKLLKSKWDIVF